VVEGEVVEHVDLTLARMAVITGRVRDKIGEPLEGADVYALK